MLATPPETRISWFRVFNDLKNRGWSIYRVQEHLSIAKGTMHGWKAGAEPSHANGERLIRLWIEVTQLTREQLPTDRRYPNARHR